MNIQKIVPGPPEIIRETLIVLGGAIIAAVIVGNWPTLREWIKKQWGYDGGEKPW